MNENNIERLHTSCKNCIFAQYQDKTQIGCNIGQLEDYRENNLHYTRHINPKIDIVEAFDDDKEYFVVNGIKCHYKRNENWGHKVNKKYWTERVKEENRIKYQSIIFTHDDFDKLTNTIESLLSQSIPPQHITVVRSTFNTIRPSTIADYLRESGLPWKIENIIDSNLLHPHIIDNVLKTRAYPYHSIFYAGKIVPQDFFETINQKIYNENLKFAIIIDDERPVVVSTAIHGVYGGNKPTSLIKKVREDKCDNLLIKIRTVYPTYPK